jgi:hypothetical protein
VTTASAAYPVRFAKTDAWLWLLVIATLAAAVVHAWVAPEHFEESPLYGGFFLATTVAGLGYAAWVLSRPARWLYAAAVVANVAIVALWLMTRLVEVPVGPGAGETEPFGTLDIVASSAEVLCVVAGIALLRAGLTPAGEDRTIAVRTESRGSTSRSCVRRG